MFCDVCTAELATGMRRLLPLLLLLPAAVRGRCSVGQQQSVNARLATEAAAEATGDPGCHASPAGLLTTWTPAAEAALPAASDPTSSAAPAASIPVPSCQSRPAPAHHLPVVAARACCCANRQHLPLLTLDLLLPTLPLLLLCGGSGCCCASILLGRKDLSQADRVWMEAPETEVGEEGGLDVCCCCCWR